LICINEAGPGRDYAVRKRGENMHLQSGNDRNDTSWHRFVTRARTAISRWNEMRRLDASEVEAIARDLNLSAYELNALAQSVPTSLEPLKLRLAYAGTSERELAARDRAVLRDLQRVCSQCSAKIRCAADLERGRRASPAKYCPNEQTLRALACEAWEPPSARVVSFPVARA
jgi:hypothetical protein